MGNYKRGKEHKRGEHTREGKYEREQVYKRGEDHKRGNNTIEGRTQERGTIPSSVIQHQSSVSSHQSSVSSSSADINQQASVIRLICHPPPHPTPPPPAPPLPTFTSIGRRRALLIPFWGTPHFLQLRDRSEKCAIGLHICCMPHSGFIRALLAFGYSLYHGSVSQRRL